MRFIGLSGYTGRPSLFISLNSSKYTSAAKEYDKGIGKGKRGFV